MKVLLPSSKQCKNMCKFSMDSFKQQADGKQVMRELKFDQLLLKFKKLPFSRRAQNISHPFLHTVQPHAPVLIKNSCTINWKISRSNNLPLIICVLSVDLLLQNGVCPENLLLFLCCLIEWHACSFQPFVGFDLVSEHWQSTLSHIKNKHSPTPTVWKILANPTLAHHKICTVNKTTVTKGRNRDTKGSGVLAPEMKG